MENKNPFFKLRLKEELKKRQADLFKLVPISKPFQEFGHFVYYKTKHEIEAADQMRTRIKQRN